VGAGSSGPNRRVPRNLRVYPSVVYVRTVTFGERGGCEVRASDPRKLQIPVASRAGVPEPGEFSFNFYRKRPRGLQKMWVRLAQVASSSRAASNAMRIGRVWITIPACGKRPSAQWRRNFERCREDAVSHDMHSIFRSLHSTFANVVFYLANTGGAFVTYESRLMAASVESGGVEASLAGKALQTSFDAFSLLVRSGKALSVSSAFKRPPIGHQARSPVHLKYPEEMDSAIRWRTEGVGMSCRRGG
jgi:hypothetical protein